MEKSGVAGVQKLQNEEVKFSGWNREFQDRRVPALFSTELANRDDLVT